MRNEIMNMLLERKFEDLKREVVCIKIMEETNLELLKRKSKTINEQETNEKIIRINKLLCRINDLQHEAIAYNNHDLVLDGWRLEKQLDEIHDEYIKFIK